MLTAVTLTLKGKEEKRHSHSLGSVLQGFLMEQLDTGYARRMHQMQLHPYSQSLRVVGKQLVWKVNTLTYEAGVEMIGKIKDLKEISLRHRGEVLQVEKVDLESISYGDLFESFYFQEQSFHIRFRFLTPASFKRQGQYMLYPTVRLIFQSLITKFNSFSSEIQLQKEDFLRDLEGYAKLEGYKMESTFFALEGANIPAFRGEIQYKIQGPQPMANLVHMLGKFGTFSGVGIKNGMGMGALAILP